MTRRWALRAGIGLVCAALLAGCGESQGKAQENGEGSLVPSDPTVAVERADKARVRGDQNAPIRLVEISDFACPFCAEFYRETYPELDSLYVSTGKVQYVWIAFPNPQHSYAWPSIEAAYCAGAVGKFWPMHDMLFEKQEAWGEAEQPAQVFKGYAAELGIDAASFAACVENDRVAPLMVRDYQNAIGAGINSTPFFILADSVAIRGAAPIDNFRDAIEDILAARGAGGADAPGADAPGADASGADASGADASGAQEVEGDESGAEGSGNREADQAP